MGDEYCVGMLEERLLKTLNERGPQIRGELCQTLDRPRTTIFDNIFRLIQHGMVISYQQRLVEHQRGRPPIYFAITETGKQWLTEHLKEGL